MSDDHKFVIASPKAASVIFSMLNRHGESVSIDLIEIRHWLRFRHPILWRRNREMRDWFDGMAGRWRT